MAALILPPAITRKAGQPGSPYVKEGSLEVFRELDETKQLEAIRGSWLEIAYTLAEKARYFARTVKYRDYSKLQALVSAAATARDKAYGEVPASLLQGRSMLVVQLFGSLDQEKVLRVLNPTKECHV